MATKTCLLNKSKMVVDVTVPLIKDFKDPVDSYRLKGIVLDCLELALGSSSVLFFLSF